MEPIENLKDVKNVNLVVFDVDGVIVPRGTKIIERGNMVTYDLKFPPEKFIEMVKELLDYTNVAISSGRSMLTLKNMFVDLLGEEKNGNTFLMQAENGGRISWGVEEIGVGHDPKKMRELFNLRKELKKIKHKNILGFEPKESIISIHCKDRVDDIEKMVKGTTFHMTWNGEAYDIGENAITKGSGLDKIKDALAKKMGKKFFTIAIGDRDNDLELLDKADISVSADPEELKGTDYFVKDSKELPGVIYAERLLELFRDRK